MILTTGAFSSRRVLDEVLKDMKKLTTRNVLKRALRSKDDTEKIAGFKEKIQNAVTILQVRSTIFTVGFGSLQRIYRLELF
jgi:hypothetical protein